MSDSSFKNKFSEIEKIIERAISIEERNGAPSDAIHYYESAQKKIVQLLKDMPLNPEAQNKLKKYHLSISDRIKANKDPNRKSRQAERIFLTGKEFFQKFAPMLKNHDSKIIEEISYNITQRDSAVNFEDIAGNTLAKSIISESVILPSLRPELFTGLRKPARGILLYGPPGNGKTLLAKAIANQCNSTFFSISAASLMDKYVGNSEKLVAALFACARVASPSIIFIDEVDALLANRNDNSNQVQFRVLTQFLTELDGCQSGEERFLVLAATNHPEVLDEAALRRFPKRIYIGQPDVDGRRQLLKLLINREDKVKFKVSESEINHIARISDNYSSSDLTELVKDSAMGPLRTLTPDQVLRLRPEDIRPVGYQDLVDSMARIRPSVNPSSLQAMHDWRLKFGDGLTHLAGPSSSNSTTTASRLFSWLPGGGSSEQNTTTTERVITVRRKNTVPE